MPAVTPAGGGDPNLMLPSEMSLQAISTDSLLNEATMAPWECGLVQPQPCDGTMSVTSAA